MLLRLRAATPFYFIKARLFVSLPAWRRRGLILALLLVKMEQRVVAHFLGTSCAITARPTTMPATDRPRRRAKQQPVGRVVDSVADQHH